jgi:hypothetical protein
VSKQDAKATESESTDGPNGAAQVAPEWPSFFPPTCPPADAEPASGEVFMLIHVPPQPKDFDSHVERRIQVHDRPCQRSSLSVGRTAKWCEQTRLVSPGLREKVVHKATLEPKHGVIKQTNRPGHYSLWIRSAWRKTVFAEFKVA